MIEESPVDIKQTIKISSIFGILCFITIPLTVFLYFIYSGIPPIWIVLLRNLISLFALVFALIFFSGFQFYIKHSYKQYEWVATLIFNTFCIYAATNLVAHSLEAGGVFNPQGIAVDATQSGFLAQGNFLLYGSIGRLLTATFMIPIGIITVKTNIVPVWTGWFAIIIGITNIAFIPSMFFGTNAADFYSAIGWGNSALAASLFGYWIFIVSIILLKKKL